MASAEYIAAAKKGNRKPTTYMSVEDASGETLYYTTQGQWQGSGTLTDVDTTEEPGSVYHEKVPVSYTLGTDPGVEPPFTGYAFAEFSIPYNSYVAQIYAKVRWPAILPSTIEARCKLQDTNDRVSGWTEQYFSASVLVTRVGTEDAGTIAYGYATFIFPDCPLLLTSETWFIRQEYFYEFFGGWTDAGNSLWTNTILDLSKPTAQLITSAIDFGEVIATNPRFATDDVTDPGAVIAYSYTYSTDDISYSSGGTIVDGDSLVASRYYKIQIDFITTNGGRGKVREIQLTEGIFRYYGSHIGEPFDGVSPQIVPDSVSSFSQKIKIDKGLSTTGEASVRLFWVPETADLIASGYLKGKDVAIYSGFVGLDTASYEPVITGTWYDHDLDEVNGIITVKIRDAFKQFEKRKIPEEVVNTTTGAITTPAITYTTTSLVTVMKDIFDNIGLRDRYISPEFDTLEAGDYAATKYKVSRTLSKPQDFSKLLDELAITGSMYLIPLGNGQIKPKPFDINQEHIAILDANEVKFTGLKGNISEFYSRFYAYYNPKTTLTDDPDDDRDDYDNATALIDANAELRWFPERGTKQHFDKWKVGRTSASTALTAPPTALNDLMSLWNSLLTEPLYTVKAVDLGPRYADIEPADVVQVDNLRLPVVDDEWVDSPSYIGKSSAITILGSQISDIGFSDDGLTFYALNSNVTGVLSQYALTAPFDITTLSTSTGGNLIVTATSTQPVRGFDIVNNGQNLYTVSSGANRVYQYSLSTPYQVNTASLVNSFDISTESLSVNGIRVNPDGSSFIISDGSDEVSNYTMDSFDITTSAHVQTVSLASETTGVSSLEISTDGTKLFVNDTSRVLQYTLGSRWNLSVVEYDSVVLDTTTESISPIAISFDDVGEKLAIADFTSTEIHQYSTPNIFSLDITYYTEGDRVVHDGKMWRARQDNDGKDPTSESTYWQDMEISADGYTQGKHFFVLGRKFNPNTAQIDLDLMEMPPATLGGFDSGFDTGFDI